MSPKKVAIPEAKKTPYAPTPTKNIGKITLSILIIIPSVSNTYWVDLYAIKTLSVSELSEVATTIRTNNSAYRALL